MSNEFNTHHAVLLHGRNAGYPAPPVQTPACSFSAPGSSVLLASAQGLLFPAGRLARVLPAQLCPARVAYAGFVVPSGPSPCTWLSHAPSTMPDKTPHKLAAGFPSYSTSPPTSRPSTRALLG